MCEEKQWEIDQLKVEKADLQQRLDVAEKTLETKTKKAQDLQNQVAFFEEKVESMQGENAAMFESSIAAKEAELNAMRAELSPGPQPRSSTRAPCGRASRNRSSCFFSLGEPDRAAYSAVRCA